MVSTFGGLNAAFTGLQAARYGTDVIGQNITNAATPGYTRQRVSTSSLGAVSNGVLDAQIRVGQGVAVDGVTRLSSSLRDARVLTTSANNGYWAVQTGALSTLETSLNEPGTDGISASLQSFWSSWQDMANHPGEAPPAAVLLQNAQTVISKIAQGYRDVVSQWSDQRADAVSTAASINDLAGRVAGLNDQIRTTLAAGGSANELLDQRAVLTTQLSALAGTTLRDHPDGTVDVVLGGNSLVTGSTARAVQVAGATELAGATTAPVQLEWTDRPGTPIELSGGSIAGSLAVLAGSDGAGDGGPLAAAADSYNALASALATQVNALHSAGSTTSGVTGLDFFSFTTGVPAALGLTVVPTDVSGIATGAPGGGALSGTTADAIAALGSAATGPGSVWSAFVVATGSASGSASSQASLSAAALAGATTAQTSEEGVDMDEETTLLMTWQHAYQGAARVMTTIDDMLDTLINRTGLVGR